MYLWDRQYGLPGYKACGLTRWLDGKVARLIGFADARANYARLNEIPERLREHAAALKAQAESEFAALKHLDEAARTRRHPRAGCTARRGAGQARRHRSADRHGGD